MKKIVTIIGARPQFIKAAVLSQAIRVKFTEVIIHTGQHYDSNMSDVFFKQLNIPKPDYNLGVGSGSHAVQTANMLIGIEKILITENPDYVLVYGDTNSTLAGALAASKLLIPVIHVEAGLRSYNFKMPEEQNRVLTDHISTYLFCPTDTAVNNLYLENIKNSVFNVGDVMCDSVLHFVSLAEEKFDGFENTLKPLYKYKNVTEWYLATIHRAENTYDCNNLLVILSALNALDNVVIFPVHPRIRKTIDNLQENNDFNNIYFVEPVDYLTMLYLTKYAKKVITDSGGLQKECYILDTPCITIRDQTEWIETLNDGYNVLSKPIYDELLNKINNALILTNEKTNYYGNGNAAKNICEILSKLD